MAKPHSLYLTDHYLVFSAGGVIEANTVFSLAFNQDDFQEKFQAFLAQSPSGVISVFVDIMGEEIKHEHIPHIGGKDRERLLQRKFKSLFPSADLTWKKHLTREKTGRKDDIYLLLGLTLPTRIKQAMNMLIESGQKVQGIYFVPILQQQLSNVLPDSSQFLIISRIPSNQHNKNTYRQTFYKNRTLVVSRVNNATGNTTKEILDQLFKEIERTYQFLDGTRQLEQNKPLQVIVMLDETEAADLIDHSTNMNIDLKYANLSELAQNIGLDSASNYDSLSALLCQLVTSKKLKPHFQPADICNQHKIDILKLRLTLSSAAIVLLSLIIASKFWLSAYHETEKYALLASKITSAERQKTALGEHLPDTQIPPKIMHQAVKLYREITDNSYKPEQVLEVIANAYNGYQDIELTQIIWINKDPASNSDALNDEVSQPGNTPFIQRLKAPAQFKIVIKPDPAMSNRTMLARVDSFSASLLQQPEITQVIREKSAIDTRSTAQLEESFGHQHNDKITDFTLLITM